MTHSMLAVVNHATVVTGHDVAAMARAVNTQLHHDAGPAWDRPAPPVHYFHHDADVPAGAFPIVILDDPDQAGVLGYHDETPDGKVYGRVFARPVLDNGGDALTKPLSVASVLSHEALETFGDQACNLWAERNGKVAYAYELCDAVESDSYPIEVPTVGVVTVSNFVLPAWFDPHGHGPFDFLRKLSTPFAMDKGGYVITQAEGKVTQQFGDHYPAWRRATKTHPAARSARRGITTNPEDQP